MGRRRFVIASPFKVYREGGGSRTMKVNEELWADVPLCKDKVTVYLDNVEFWTYRNEFDASVQPYSQNPL